MRKPVCIGLVITMAAGLITVNRMNLSLVEKRGEIGITQTDPVRNAPPLVVFTTVALGGFRGIIADFLWMRSAKLQQEGKYFELVQLADWITKLEPRFSDVWIYHAWNLSYNISVMMIDHEDRWRWVRHGFSLLRDEALYYNPDDPDVLLELGRIFQHKIGMSLDDAHMVYKESWAREMQKLFGGERPDYAALSEKDARKIREEYKLDPQEMARIEREYGNVDWRMPQAHALYWAVQSRKFQKANQRIFAERMIYQALADAYLSGRARFHEETDAFIPSPDFDLLPFVLRTYENVIPQFPDIPGLQASYQYFLSNAIILDYIFGRDTQAVELLNILKRMRPDIPSRVSLEEYVVVTYTRKQSHMDNERDRIAISRALRQKEEAEARGDMKRARGYERLINAIRSSNPALSGNERIANPRTN